MFQSSELALEFTLCVRLLAEWTVNAEEVA